jgi:uncharacterized protein (DUF2062 family)
MFLGMTPTVGLQITALGLLFAFFTGINRWSGDQLKFLKFNLPIAIAMTWISNPADMIFLYFGFYATGCLVLPGYELLGFSEFFELLQPMTQVQGLLGNLDHAGEYFSDLHGVFLSLGDHVLMPLCLGSLIIAIPLSFLTYFGIAAFVRNYQNKRLEHAED